jgi:excisionase family DNA binding protein
MTAPTTITPDLLTIPDVMAHLNLSRSTVYHLLRTGRLHSVTIGRARRIPTTSLTTYLDHLTHQENQP